MLVALKNVQHNSNIYIWLFPINCLNIRWALKKLLVTFVDPWRSLVHCGLWQVVFAAVLNPSLIEQNATDSFSFSPPALVCATCTPVSATAAPPTVAVGSLPLVLLRSLASGCFNYLLRKGLQQNKRGQQQASNILETM